MTLTRDRDAEAAYDALAPAYDALTAAYPYDLWLERLLAIAVGHGLTGRRVLDLACGTGNSFLPLLARGYDVVAADVSPAMCAIAAAKAGGSVPVHVADMRELPSLGRFDLVTCIDDSMNYLLDPAEVVAALRGVRAQLVPGGLLVFDVNSLRLHRETFTETWATDSGEHVILWRGTGDPELAPGGETSATIDVFSARDGAWARSTAVHRQRNHPVAELVDALAEAGLDALAVYGQHPGAVLEPGADELLHHKVVLVARRPAGGESHMVARP